MEKAPCRVRWAEIFCVVMKMYHKYSPINGDDGSIRVKMGQPLNYTDMVDYIKAWPDKLVTFVAERLCEDHMAVFARELYEHICCRDADGPDFEQWRQT